MTAGSITIFIDQLDGQRSALKVPLGMSVMRAAVDAGLHGIVGECGGATMCATCHVYVNGGPIESLAPLNAAEDQMLQWTASERLPSSRLSCQLVAGPEMAGLVLKLPEAQA